MRLLDVSRRICMLAIHDRPGSYSDRWLTYCASKGLAYKAVNCLSNDIGDQLQGALALLWHWSHYESGSLLAARQLTAALEYKGLLVYPNRKTCWHYDDKIAQKYLLEAVGAPLVPTWVFFSDKEAMLWIKSTTWPKVFKLRCGAGSANVRLVRSQAEALSVCRQAFGRGFRASKGYLDDIRTRLRKTKTAAQFWDKLRRVPRIVLFKLALGRQIARQVGYVYFQEFMPSNSFDTRVTIIGARAFAFRRLNRPDDFRASGSGSVIYDTEGLDLRCVKIAYDIAARLDTQSLAFDFLLNPGHEPVIVEISYGFMAEAIYACPGYWDPELSWHDGHVWPQDAIIEDLLQDL